MNSGSVSFEKTAQCGQVGDAYSITVTLASAGPSTLSGRPFGASSLAWSNISPSAAWAAPIPVTLRADAAAARIRVSRRVNFTLFSPVRIARHYTAAFRRQVGTTINTQ